MRPRIPTTVSEVDDDHERLNTFSHTSDQEIEEEEELISHDSDEYHGRNGDEDEDDYRYDDDYDDDEAPVWTFRVLYLGSLSSLFLYILNKFFLHQTAQCIMSMVTTVAVLYPIGHIMAKLMPKRRVFLRSFGVEFSLNPGPFDVREFALISIFANSGAAYGGITSHSVHSFGSFDHSKYN